MIVALSVTFGAAATGQQPKRGEPKFVEVACGASYGTFDHIPPAALHCGTITVPQNRAAPNDARLVDVVLPVVLVKMPGATGTPLVFLAGGPGESAIDASQRAFFGSSIGQLMIRERPVIAFDRRGVTTDVGRTSPDLGMLVSSSRPRSNGAAASLIDSAKRAARRARDRGVDLRYFGTPDAVEDIRDVAIALGHSKLVLFGVSYGTRDALQFIRRHPEMVERAVLDGVAPPQSISLFHPDTVANVRRRVVRQVAAECNADPACATEYPNLDAALTRLANGAPLLRITAHLPEAGGWRTVDVEPGLVLSTIGGAAGIEQIRAIVPQLLEDFARGDTLRRPLSPDVLLAAAADSALRLGGPRAMPLVYHVTLCSDTPDGPMASGGRTTCDMLGVPFAGPGVVEPVSSNVPVLLIASGYDSQTPSNLATEAARTLPKSYTVLFRSVGHIAFRQRTTMACAAIVIASFLARSESEPATSCVESVKPSFLPRNTDLKPNGT